MDKYDTLKLKNQLCFPLYAAYRAVVKGYHPTLKAIDLTYTQYLAMMVLWEEKEIAVGELGKRLFLDSGTLTPMLKAMEKKGLLSRERDKDDERRLVVAITERGEALKEEALAIPARGAKCVPLAEDEAKELYRLLYKILDHEPPTA